MIVLPIHKQDEDDDTPQEWSLLELNGELLCPKSEPDGDSMELGSVEFDAEGSPVMTIASHELKGKIEKLKRPFVVMKPKQSTANNNSSDTSESNKRIKLSGETDAMDVDDTHSTTTGYEVAGIVTSKMLFDRYPKSIMK